MRRFIDRGLANLSPSYFALVMATGIVSIACWLVGIEWLARALLCLNAPAYAILVVLTLARVFRHPARVISDFSDHGRAPGFFTAVAGTSVLGTQLLMIEGPSTASWVLWFAAAVLGLAITYAFFAVLTVKQEKPTIETGLNGSWLIAVVETQSVALLGPLLAAGLPAGQTRETLLFFCLCLFFVGCLLYLMLITLILYRFMFFRFTLVELAPPYWINMGAVAITTVVGANLIDASSLWPFLAALTPFLRGLVIAFWAIATWWIPLLLVLGAWRHGIERFRLAYDPQYWGMVFPLGMYTTATVRLATTLELPFLLVIPRYFVFVAIAAWALTLLGLVLTLGRSLAKAARAA